MNNINYFVPIINNQKNAFASFLDEFFSCGQNQTKYQVISKQENTLIVRKITYSDSYAKTALKVALIFTLIVPIMALIYKAAQAIKWSSYTITVQEEQPNPINAPPKIRVSSAATQPISTSPVQIPPEGIPFYSTARPAAVQPPLPVPSPTRPISPQANRPATIIPTTTAVQPSSSRDPIEMRHGGDIRPPVPAQTAVQRTFFAEEQTLVRRLENRCAEICQWIDTLPLPKKQSNPPNPALANGYFASDLQKDFQNFVEEALESIRRLPPEQSRKALGNAIDEINKLKNQLEIHLGLKAVPISPYTLIGLPNHRGRNCHYNAALQIIVHTGLLDYALFRPFRKPPQEPTYNLELFKAPEKPKKPKEPAPLIKTITNKPPYDPKNDPELLVHPEYAYSIEKQAEMKRAGTFQQEIAKFHEDLRVRRLNKTKLYADFEYTQYQQAEAQKKHDEQYAEYNAEMETYTKINSQYEQDLRNHQQELRKKSDYETDLRAYEKEEKTRNALCAIVLNMRQSSPKAPNGALLDNLSEGMGTTGGTLLSISRVLNIPEDYQIRTQDVKDIATFMDIWNSQEVRIPALAAGGHGHEWAYVLNAEGKLIQLNDSRVGAPKSLENVLGELYRLKNGGPLTVASAEILYRPCDRRAVAD